MHFDAASRIDQNGLLVGPPEEKKLFGFSGTGSEKRQHDHRSVVNDVNGCISQSSHRKGEAASRSVSVSDE